MHFHEKNKNTCHSKIRGCAYNINFCGRTPSSILLDHSEPKELRSCGVKKYKRRQSGSRVESANIIGDVKDKLMEKPEIIVYGKVCHQHRSVGFFSDESIGNKYSGKLMKSSPLTDNLRYLLRDMNETFDTHFNGILVNRYEGGSDYISAHSDDEKGIRVNDVVSISWGTVRTFRIRHKSDRKIAANIPTESGKIIHMGGEFQPEFTHEIPIEK